MKTSSFAARVSGIMLVAVVGVGLVSLPFLPGPAQTLGSLAQGVSTFWAPVHRLPVADQYGSGNPRDLKGRAVYLWTENGLRWVGLVEEAGHQGNTLIVQLRVTEAERLTARAVRIYWRPLTVPEMWDVLSSNEDVAAALSRFASTAGNRIAAELPTIVSAMWDEGLDEALAYAGRRVTEKLQDNEPQLSESAKRVARSFVQALLAPQARARWEPVVRAELEPVIKHIVSDAFQISFRDAVEIGKDAARATVDDQQTVAEVLANVAVKRLQEASAKNEIELRRAVNRICDRLLEDENLRKHVVTRVTPVVSEELDRVKDILMEGVQEVLRDPVFQSKLFSVVESPPVRRALADLAQSLRDDAENALKQALLNEDGRLRGEIAFLVRVTALGEDNLPCVVLCEDAPRNLLAKGGTAASAAGE